MRVKFTLYSKNCSILFKLNGIVDSIEQYKNDIPLSHVNFNFAVVSSLLSSGAFTKLQLQVVVKAVSKSELELKVATSLITTDELEKGSYIFPKITIFRFTI
jgi:hypothetical protein